MADSESDIAVKDIDGAFVPTHGGDVTSVELDGERVLLAEDSGRVHWLDPIGTIVWDCFDGMSSVDEIVTDLAEAFRTPVDPIRSDVLELTRQLGSAGVLEGVAPVPMQSAGPVGYEVGDEMPPFELVDTDGHAVASGGLRGRRMLLVNWSPTCGFCRKIAPELSDATASLREHDVSLVFVSVGDVDANRELLPVGPDYTILIQELDTRAELFEGLGTPAAYVVDENGAIASSLALGADQVPDLVRSLVTEPAAADRGH